MTPDPSWYASPTDILYKAILKALNGIDAADPVAMSMATLIGIALGLIFVHFATKK